MKITVRMKLCKTCEWFNQEITIPDEFKEVDKNTMDGVICDILDELHPNWYRYYKLK